MPAVANETLADSSNAPSYVRRVRDQLDAAEIADALAGLSVCRRSQYFQEREHYLDTHNFGSYASRLIEALGLGN